ncbi:MAG TPA: hypothetical protein VGM87_06555 [Roseomonas sp.]
MWRYPGLCLILTFAGCAGDGLVARQAGIADENAHAARIAPRPGPRNCRWPALDNPRLAARIVDGSLRAAAGESRQAVLFRCGTSRR